MTDTNRGTQMQHTDGTAGQELPPVPDHIREAAREAPDHWIGVVDPAWTDAAPPPPWAVAGEWRSGLDGEVAEWQPNEEYRPSPSALGWPEPTDPVDAAVQLAVTGYGPLSDALEALAGAEAVVLRAPGGGPLTVAGADGSPAVPLFTAVPHQPFEGALAHDTVAVADLVRELAADEGRISVNPAGPARILLDARLILDAVRPAVPAVPAVPDVPTSATGSIGSTGGSPDSSHQLPTSPVTQRTP
ncbi:type VII secretion system-associated protein [Streptomyces atratus]|uniref:type VII secretion system-associated protein n=1 Tax=Streptomyces atratus TaxID=1893 RepID=UPI0021A4CFA1|nr:type VII secretion system-associated protein [Streptomyces atratus]MCT2544188.1 type VII secretion system-associated protein [Streptomyces atratus]